MKPFLKNILIFVALLVLLLISGYILTSTILSRQAEFENNSNYNSILVGHSHPEMAFNDSLISSLRNFADGAESYIYTYHKIKFILSKNSSIDTIFIDFSNNSFDDNDRVEEKSPMGKFLSIYNPFMNLESNLTLLKSSPPSYIYSVAKSIIENTIKIITQNVDYTYKMGDYYYHEINNLNLSEVEQMSVEHDTINQSEYFIKNPTIDLIYLQKTIELCKSLNKNVYLIRSPVHPKWQGFRDEITYQAIRNELFSDVEYLDFSKFPLEIQDYRDFQHLNYKGAEKFSKWFSQMIDDSLLVKNDKQEFIDSEIEKLQHQF